MKDKKMNHVKDFNIFNETKNAMPEYYLGDGAKDFLIFCAKEYYNIIAILAYENDHTVKVIENNKFEKINELIELYRQGYKSYIIEEFNDGDDVIKIDF